MKLRPLLIILTAILINPVSGLAADWPVWRGPTSDSRTSEKFDPKKLSGNPQPAWHINVNSGYSSVIVLSNYLFTMGNDGQQDIVYCLNAETGQEIWKATYPCPKGGGYPGPRATPVLDGPRLYTVSRQGDVHCWDARSGKMIWHRNLVNDFDTKLPKWAISASARISGAVVLINANTHGIALDKMTGKTVWASPPGIGGYAVPQIFEEKGQERVAIFGEKHLYSVDVGTGKKLWEYPWQTSHNVNAADPEIDGTRIFISSGYNTGCTLLDISSGTPQKLWQNKGIASHFSSCIIENKAIYGISGNAGRRGQLVSLDLETGNQNWSSQLGFGSFIVADGKFIILTENGEVIVARLQPDKYEELSRGKAMDPKGRCWTMPVLANGRLFCRSSSGELVAIDVSP